MHAPARIGRYVLQGELGRGAMGVVFRAVDPRLRRHVAIKLVLPGGDRARLLRRLSVEAVALGRLRHPGIVTLHEMGEHEGVPYMVMDLVAGRPLHERLEHEGPLAPREAARVAREVALALAHAHARGVLHRDVKPSNVLLASEGGAVLTDFGLARDEVLQSGLSQAGTIIGTPGYWPPEQARGKRELVGPASDVYGLGATLFAMLTGQPPFTGETLVQAITAVCGEPAPAPSSVTPGVDRALDAIVLRALAKAPADRFPSAEAFAEALGAYLDAAAAAPARRAHGRRVAAGAAAVALAAAAVVAAVVAPRDAAPPQANTPPDASAVEPAPAAPVSVAPPAGPPPAARQAFLEGLVRQAKGRHDEADAAFSRALRDAPDLAPALYRRGVSRLARGDVPGAVADATRAVEVQGAWDAAPWAYRGAARAEAGDHAGAIADFDEAAARHPEAVALAVARAATLLDGGRRDDGVAALTQVIERRPDAWRAHYYRGWARARADDHRGAVDDFTRVIALAPTAPGVWHERARARLHLDDLPGALTDAYRAVTGHPKDPEGWYVRADVRAALGDAAGAHADLTRLLELAPERARAWCNRGSLRLALRDPRGALADLDEAIRRGQPGWAWPIGQRGRARALLGDHAGALEDFERFLAASPGDEYHPIWAAGLGGGDPARLEAVAASEGWLAVVARRALGRASDAEAEAVIQAAATLRERRERTCVVHGFLGLLAERDGDPARATAHYRRCAAVRLVMWAQHHWAVNRLAALGGR